MCICSSEKQKNKFNKGVIELIEIKSKREIELMREACKIANLTQKEVEKHIKPGVSTFELDKVAENFIRSQNAIPAQKNYPHPEKGIAPFPATLCVSVNDVIIHGIPSKKEILKDGDIVSVDLVVYKNGFHGDCARTYIVKETTQEAKRLVEVTKQAFYEGIRFAKAGNRIGDISHAVSEFVNKNGYSVIKEFEGHGIGRQMHEEPAVPNYGKAGKGIRLIPGMTIAVEPMVVMQNTKICELEDGWTIVTDDGSLAAHYENTILITEKEPEILTI